MGFLLSIDPGIRGVGAALFDMQTAMGANPAGVLRAASYVRNPAKEGNGPRECATLARAVDLWLGQFLLSLGKPFYATDDLDTIVLEWPQVYRQGQLKGDPGDLLPLAGVDAAIAALAPSVEIKHYLPREWKGQLPKGVVFEGRVLDRLTTPELAILNETLKGLTPSLHHNVFDACGLGLYTLGRFDQKRVFAR
jgi:hypothetical protein